MKKNLILIAKGFIIGIANIIPGVSGGTLMITLGIYEEVINTISHFFTNFKKNIKFILPLALGMGLSILLLSKVISVCLDKFPFPTTIFFIGLILGGIPLLFKKVKHKTKSISNWSIFLITFVFVATFGFLKSGNNVVSFDNISGLNCLLLFLVGMLASSTMIIPGISGSFVLMLLGYYEPIINTVKNLTNFSILGHNLLILIPFGLGVLLGIVLVSKLIEFLLKKYEIKTYFGVLGFVLASIIAIIIPLKGTSVSILELLCSVILFGIGLVVAYKLGEK